MPPGGRKSESESLFYHLFNSLECYIQVRGSRVGEGIIFLFFSSRF